jgi:molybdopterin-binding protein
MNAAYTLKDLEQVYGAVVALKLDHMSIDPAGITALVGPNGSGKSTLLDLLAFIRLPAKGRIVFFGDPVSRNNYTQLRRHIGYVQQKPYLFNLTVAKNIELGLKLRNIARPERQRRVAEIIGMLALHELVQRRAHELSGGEIQKVAVARALVLQPRILILDEPFTHLDRESRRDLEQLLLTIRQAGKQNIIFSSHDSIQAHMLADNICSLMEGQAVPALANNLFRGVLDKDNNLFDTGKIRIHVPPGYKSASLFAIDSTHLVLSLDKLESSMRNSFQGVVKSLREESGNIHVTVDCGELFHIMITCEAWRVLRINIGDDIWVSFKSTAVNLS